jgi:hypothetical protein
VAFKKDEPTGGLRWDRSTAGDRWGRKANRPDVVEFCEMLIDQGNTGSIWDTLADPAYRPADLHDDEERLIVRRALRRDAELGRLDASMVEVLIRLIGGKDRLKTELRGDLLMRAAARAHIQANPGVSLGQLRRRFGFTRETARAIKGRCTVNR